MKKVILKENREFPIRNYHSWIFSGAIESLPEIEAGELLPVYSHSLELLGWGYFNPKCSLIGRMVSFGNEEPFSYMKRAFEEAVSLRRELFDETITNGYRIINGEGDGFPGLVIDKYAHILVMQIGSAGMEKLKPFLLELLKSHFPKCRTIYEKSTLASRKLEGLEDCEGFLLGGEEETEIVENSLKFKVEIKRGQKTGFFLDQREMRRLIGELSAKKRVLNCFAYSGAFSVYAAHGKAESVDSVETSKAALELAKYNLNLNKSEARANFYKEDVFEFLKKDLSYDIIILDPPAFVKQQKDLKSGTKAYFELNKLAFKNSKRGTLILTCSCSSYVDKELFQKILFKAAIEAQRKVKIISSHRLALDHPISLFHKEGEYLKSFLLALY